MLFPLTPGGFGRLLIATSEPAAERRIPGQDEALPDYEAVSATARRFGCELLD